MQSEIQNFDKKTYSLGPYLIDKYNKKQLYKIFEKTIINFF